MVGRHVRATSRACFVWHDSHVIPMMRDMRQTTVLSVTLSAWTTVCSMLLVVLTPPENGDVHVSFQGAELRGDYLCVRDANRIFRQPSRKGSTVVIKPRKE